MSSSISPLSKDKEWKISSMVLLQVFLCLPLRGFISHSWLSSCLGYLLSGSLQTLYHHFNFALSLLLFKVSKPMSPQTASLHVLEEHPRIFFAPPKMMDSNALAWDLLQSQISLPYSRLGLTTESSRRRLAVKFISLLLITLCNWLTFFLQLSRTFWICTSQAPLHAKSIPR